MKQNSIDLGHMGKRIKELRIKQNKTQKYLADLLYISPSYLTLIEQGKRTPTLDVLVQISNVFNVTTDYLLFGVKMEADTENYHLFENLSLRYSSLQMSKALHLAEYYLALEDISYL